MKFQTTIKDFKRARIEFDDTAQDVADKLGFSKDYIYKCIKYPNMNPDLHRKIADYCKRAKEEA